MSNVMAELEDLHLKHDLLGSIEVGITVVNQDFEIQIWNQFMEHHSGMSPANVRGKTLFENFPEIDADWFKRKTDPVFKLRSPAFIIWEQRPHLFKFEAYRPITSSTELMYQNITIFPLTSLTGEVNQICIVVYDVTDEAISKQRFEAANKQLERISRVDGLTGLYNRRYWEEMCGIEFKRAMRTGSAATMMILDIDHFKRINDTYGHPAGDKTIKTLARIIAKAIRETDIAGRYGGEEFTIVLPDTDVKSARIVAERIRKLAEHLPVEWEDQTIQFTVSVGLAEFHSSFGEYMNWVEKADQGLYEAKESGRNRVIINS
jgi:diguanylate cyclase (GGDEF)-like protein